MECGSHGPEDKQYGPVFLRYECIQLGALCSHGSSAGWRDADQSRVDMLTALFLGVLFERGVACCVQILDKEDPLGQKLIDDGVSTVEALKICAKEHEKNDEATPVARYGQSPWLQFSDGP